MIKKLIPALGVLLVLYAASGCQSSAAGPGEDALVPTGGITPYRTATLAATQMVVTDIPTPTHPPLPTPTPFMYTVVADDTMIAIAVRFGITLDELQVANPEVSPNFLTIGTQLVIPLSFDDEEGAAAGDELLPLEEGGLECSAVRSGGMWCYWLVTNPLEQPVENISGMIRLYDQNGEQVAAKEAAALLNVLEPKAQTPLVVYFAPPVAEWRLVQGQLLSAVTVNQYEQRYIQGVIEGLNVEIDPQGLRAEVSGSLQLSAGQLPEYVWVLGVAYDAEGVVVGVRRWEAPADQLTANPVFVFDIFSLTRPIERVEVLFEARALPAE